MACVRLSKLGVYILSKGPNQWVGQFFGLTHMNFNQPITQHSNRRLHFKGDERKRILVTGASGAIGSELTRLLKSQPHQDVLTLSTPTQGRINIQDRGQIRKLLEQQPVDQIYHLAALNPFKSNRGIDYFKTNVEGTENLLQGALSLKKQGKKPPAIFLASSALVYTPERIAIDPLPTTPPITEETLEPLLTRAAEQVPQSALDNGTVSDSLRRQFNLSKDEIYYNDSKLLAEMTARVYANAGVPVKVGRLVNCYGNQSNQLINQLINEANTGKPLTLANKDSEARDYLLFDSHRPQQDDVLRLIQAVAEKGKAGEAYNISSAGRFVRSPQSLVNLVQQIHKRAKAQRPNHAEPSIAAIPTKSTVILSNQKLLGLGVQPPRTSPEEGIRLICSTSAFSPLQRMWRAVQQAISRVWRSLQHIFKKWVRIPHSGPPLPASSLPNNSTQ